MNNGVVRPIRIANGRIVIGRTNAAIMQIIIVFLTFFTLLTPRDTMGLKKVFLGIALIFSINSIIRGLEKNRKILFFAVVLPVLMYIISTMVTGSPTLAISYLYPFVYLLLIFPIIKWNIDLQRIVLYVGNIMIALIIISCILDFLGLMSIYDNWLLTWLDTNGEAQISKSTSAMFRYVLFFNASPILFFNLTYYIKENRKILIALTFVALLFTGTRANIYLSAALLVFGMLFLSPKVMNKILLAICVFAIIVFFGAELLERYFILENAKSYGDTIRWGGFYSIIEVMNSHKSYWLTGMGFGSTYYNAGKMGMVSTSELSYFEFIREIGLPLSIMVFGFLSYPLFKLLKKNKFLFVAYGAYLAAGFFEPFIFTSTGFFVVMMVYVAVFKG